MVTQGVLEFQTGYHQDGPDGQRRAAAVPDLAFRSGLVELERRHLTLRRGGQGWTDEQVVLALVLLNLTGGESVSDLEVPMADEGCTRLLRRVEQHGLCRSQRREMERRSVPSATAVFRYLAGFEIEGDLAGTGKAVLPAPSAPLQGLRVIADLVGYAQQCRPSATATQDMDATLSATHKREALFSYQGLRTCQPLNTW